MTLRNVPNSYTLEQQRQEINLMAVDLDTAVDGIQTFTGAKTFGDTVTFSTDVTFQAQAFWGDGDQAIFGADSDLLIYTNGTDSYIDSNTGILHIQGTTDFDSIATLIDGVSLKFATNSNDDFEIFHNGANAYLYNNTGDFYIQNDTNSNSIFIQAAGGAGGISVNALGSVDLHYDQYKKFETTSTGVTVSGNVVIDIGTETATLFGGSNEFYIRNTDGTGGGGAVNIQGRSGASLWTGTGQLAVAANSSGAGVLYYQSAEKLAATSTGVSITGTASATEFSGPVTGNADTATALETARNIAGQSFDGTADITIAATDLSDTDQALATTSDVTFNSITKSGGLSTEFLKADGTVDSSTYLTSYTETDPVVAAINGIVKSNGTTISAAVAGTDYVASVGSESYTKFGTSTSPNPGIASTTVGSYILDEAQTSDIETSFTMTSGYTKALITLNAMIWNVTDGTTEALVEIERSVAGGAYSKIGTFIFPVVNTFYGAMNFTLIDTHGATAGDAVSYKLKNGNSVANGYSDESIRLVTGTCGDIFGVREIA